MRKRSILGKNGALAISVELPSGSHIRGSSPMADFVCEGVIGDCRLKTSLGDVRIQRADDVRLRTGYGDISLEHVAGDAELTVPAGSTQELWTDGPSSGTATGTRCSRR